MTGVAALMEGRQRLLSDLSPAAVHIARNYTTPCDPSAFAATLRSFEKAVEPTIAWLYRPYRLGPHGRIYDLERCLFVPGRAVIKLSIGMSFSAQKAPTSDHLACPSCGTRSRKASLEWVGEVPVESHTSAGSNRIDTHSITREERALIEGADVAPDPLLDARQYLSVRNVRCGVPRTGHVYRDTSGFLYPPESSCARSPSPRDHRQRRGTACARHCSLRLPQP